MEVSSVQAREVVMNERFVAICVRINDQDKLKLQLDGLLQSVIDTTQC